MLTSLVLLALSDRQEKGDCRHPNTLRRCAAQQPPGRHNNNDNKQWSSAFHCLTTAVIELIVLIYCTCKTSAMDPLQGR